MPIQLLPDGIQIGNFKLSETSTGLTFTGTASVARTLSKTQAQGDVAGYTSGGYTSTAPTQTNTIDKFPFATIANASDVGDITVARVNSTGQSSTVSGYTSGGHNLTPPATYTNIIDKFPFATNANATDVGDLVSINSESTGVSSTVNGYVMGGQNPGAPAPTFRYMQKFPFATNANATGLTGVLLASKTFSAGQSSTTHGYNSGGRYAGTDTNVIERFSFATEQNTTDVGDLSSGTARGYLYGQSSSVSGYTSGGSPSSNIIDKFPFATNANATDVGRLSIADFYRGASQSSTSFGYVSGGRGVPGNSVNNIESFPFATDSNSSDVGDLSVTRQAASGQQV